MFTARVGQFHADKGLVKNTFRYLSWLAISLLLAAGIWKLYAFMKFVESRQWSDQYPNQTHLLADAIRAGPGTYDLFSIYGDISGICISFHTDDPRQLAVKMLHKDAVKLEGDQPFFAFEHTTAIIVFDRQDNFRMEELNNHQTYVFAGEIKKNTCFDHPSVARVTVEAKKLEFSPANISATFVIK